MARTKTNKGNAKSKAASSQLIKGFSIKNAIEVGILVYLSTLFISVVIFLIMELLISDFTNITVLISQNISERVYYVYQMGIVYGLSSFISLFLYATVSWYEEKRFLKNLNSTKNVMIDGLIFFSIFIILDFLLGFILVPMPLDWSESVNISVKSICNNYFGGIIYWILAIFVAILPSIIYIFKKQSK